MVDFSLKHYWCISEFKLHYCYRPYIQGSTGIKRELILDQDQCAEYKTNGTSRAMG